MTAFGEVVSVRMPVDPFNGQTRGFAFVQFKAVASAKKAVLSDGMKLYDRKIKIKVADKRIQKPAPPPSRPKQRYEPERSIGRYVGVQSESPERERSRSLERRQLIEEDFEDRMRVMGARKE